MMRSAASTESTSPTSWWAAVVAFPCLVAVAIAALWSDGGHLSLDSVQQMVEAATGRSTSWSPPFMSALLSVLGGVPFDVRAAAERFVVLSCLLLWGGFLLAASVPRAPRFAALRWAAIALLVLNPVLLAYAGIVWKDVLFAGLAVAAFGAVFQALGSRQPTARVVWAALALALGTLLPEARQHGIFIWPFLALMVVMAIVWIDGWTLGRRLAAALMLLLLAVGVHFAAGHFAAARVVNAEAASTSVGIRSVASFDLLGIETRIEIGPLRQDGLSEAADRELVDAFTSDRIDFFHSTTQVKAYLDSRTTGQLTSLWLRAVVAYPTDYLAHRWAVSKRLFGADGGACLPVHVGISGLPHQVEALGLVEAIDAHDVRVYATVQPYFDSPLFFHGTYVLGLLLMVLLLPLMPWRSRRILALACLGVAAYYGSFLVTGIACDFRYLFPGLALVSLILVAVLAGWREASDLPRSSAR